MPHFHTYFLSSLPSLHFLGPPPMAFEKFVSLCEQFVPEEEVKIIKNVSISGDYQLNVVPESLKKWQDFDIALRNELTKIRSGRKHLDPAKYLRKQEYLGFNLAQVAVNITRNPLPLEVHKAFDLERWRFLDELSLGHYFDLDLLVIYALKLLILEHWQEIQQADKNKTLENILTKF